MFAEGTGLRSPGSTPVNSRVVPHVDPNNPVVAQPNQGNSGQDFMRLMIEQLKNQDPMNPTQGAEFTQQLASINSLEQLVSINKALTQNTGTTKLSEALGLIGYYVQGYDANGKAVQGMVERVGMFQGIPALKIGNEVLLVEQVFTVGKEPPAAEEQIQDLPKDSADEAGAV